MTETRIVEDNILGRRRFAAHVQAMLDRATSETGLSEDEILSACIFENMPSVVNKLKGAKKNAPVKRSKT